MIRGQTFLTSDVGIHAVCLHLVSVCRVTAILFTSAACLSSVCTANMVCAASANTAITAAAKQTHVLYQPAWNATVAMRHLQIWKSGWRRCGLMALQATRDRYGRCLPVCNMYDANANALALHTVVMLGIMSFQHILLL